MRSLVIAQDEQVKELILDFSAPLKEGAFGSVTLGWEDVFRDLIGECGCLAVMTCWLTMPCLEASERLDTYRLRSFEMTGIPILIRRRYRRTHAIDTALTFGRRLADYSWVQGTLREHPTTVPSPLAKPLKEMCRCGYLSTGEKNGVEL